MKLKIRSRIKEYFPVDLLIEINDIAMSYDLGINAKGEKVVSLLRQYGVKFDSLGSGTNRYGIMIDGYAFKIALDQLGKNDNLREFKYSRELQPYVIKVYESTRDGLIAATEYVKTFKSKHLMKYECRMREILSELSKSFLIGDVGISSKCSENWGRRSDGTICIMDFAYIFSITFSKFVCKCGNVLHYDSRFVDLVCPKCGYHTTFEEFRNKISTKDEEDEIGDITEHAYIQNSVYQIHEADETKTVKSTQQLEQEEKQRKKQEKKAEKKELKRKEREKEMISEIDNENHFTVEDQEKLLEDFNREVGGYHV